MEGKEFSQFITRMKAYFPNMLMNTEVMAVWREALEDVPLDDAVNRLKAYANENKYPPSVADIRGAKKKVNAFGDIAQRKPGESYDLSRICELDIQCLQKHGLAKGARI